MALTRRLSSRLFGDTRFPFQTPSEHGATLWLRDRESTTATQILRIFAPRALRNALYRRGGRCGPAAW
jgi:hypothetical protein